MNSVQGSSSAAHPCFWKLQLGSFKKTPKQCILRLLWVISSKGCFSFCLNPPTSSLHWSQGWELKTVNVAHKYNSCSHPLWALLNIPENLRLCPQWKGDTAKQPRSQSAVRVYETSALKCTFSLSLSLCGHLLHPLRVLAGKIRCLALQHHLFSPWNQTSPF